MKAKASLSAVLGFVFGLIGYFVLLILDTEQSLQLSILGGFLSAVLLFLFLVVYEKILNKRYAKFEKEITSPVFYKTNGNFNLGNGKFRNGNIYFCETGIICVCLEEKPNTFDEIFLQDIDHYQFDNIHLNIFTKDGRVFVITVPDVQKIINVLQEKKWI